MKTSPGSASTLLSSAFPRKRSKASENALRAALVDGNGSPSLNPCDSCLLAGVICWVSSDPLKCSLCLRKNRLCSISAEREFAELVEAHRSLNIQIDQARERLETACASVGVALKELNSLCEQKKSLTSSGISGMRAASRTVNAGLVQQVPPSDPFDILPLLFPEDMDPVFAQLMDSNS